MVVGFLLSAPPVAAEGSASYEFPNRTFFVTRSPPGGPRGDTFTVNIAPSATGEWWVTADVIAGSAVVVSVGRSDGGSLVLENSFRLRSGGVESMKTLMTAGLAYQASFTPFGKPGTSVLREHFAPLLWIRQFGTITSDYAHAVAVDGSGVYVAGSTDFALPGQTEAGAPDAFLRKYDADGTELWTRQFGTVRGDYAHAVAVDGSGVYVVGFTGGTFLGQESAGNADAFLRKYDADGTEVWTRQFGTDAYDEAAAVIADGSGVYAAGHTQGVLSGETSAGAQDVFLRKYDADGTEVWTRQFGTDALDIATAIAVDGSGVYVAGVTEGALPGQTYGGDLDAFLRRYDKSGTEGWTHQFGTSRWDVARAVATDASGVYVAGWTLGTLPDQASAGGLDAFLRKYDADGTEGWTRQFGTDEWEYAYAVATDSSGVYVAGSTGGTFPGQTKAGSGSSLEAFVRKYDTSGTEVWTRQFGSAVGLVEAYAVAADPSGVYAAGVAIGPLPGQTPLGGQDAFLGKLVP